MQDYRLICNIKPGAYYPGDSEQAVSLVADVLGTLINYRLGDSKMIAVTASYSSLASTLLAIEQLDIAARMLYSPAIQFKVYGEYSALQAIGQVGPGAYKTPISDIWDPWAE